MQMKKSIKAALIGGSVLALAAGAASAAVDTTAATGAFTSVETAVNAVGPLMLAAVAAGIVYKWVTAFLI